MKPQAAREPTSFEEIAAAYRHARFAEAARAIDARFATGVDPKSGLIALRARIALKNDPPLALEILARHAAAMRTSGERAEAAMLAGIAYARLGDRKAAVAKLDVAAKAARDPQLMAEIAYARAQAAWIARKLSLAERLLTAVRPMASQDVRLEAAVLRGAIAASRGNPAEQGALLLEALHELRRHGDPPVLTWAVIASQIAYLSRELPGTSLRDAALDELAKVPWTPDLGGYRFTMTRAIGWRHALDGDYFNAFRRFKDASRLAPTPPWQVMASCDRAYVATVLGESRWAEQELSDAHELAAGIAWQALDGEERFALLVLAELFAPHDASLALAYVARYKSVGKHFDATLASRSDRRVEAGEAYAFGVVQAALGERDEAKRLLEAAYAVYAAIGYEWRAGRAASALERISNNPSWRERAHDMLRSYPRSWLAAPRVERSHRERPELAKLTLAQRSVYDLLLTGRSTAEIAAEQGRSEFTIRNHIKVIFKVFGVNSRPALLARNNES